MNDFIVYAHFVKPKLIAPNSPTIAQFRAENAYEGGLSISAVDWLLGLREHLQRHGAIPKRFQL